MWEDRKSTILLRNDFPVSIIYFPWSFFTVEHKCCHARQHLHPWAVILGWFLLWSSLLSNSYCLIQCCPAFQWPFMSVQSGWKILKVPGGNECMIIIWQWFACLCAWCNSWRREKKGAVAVACQFLGGCCCCYPSLHFVRKPHQHQNISQEP